MTPDLEDFEAALARVEQRLQLERDWGLTESRIRRRLRRPLWQLTATLLSIALCVVAALNGVTNGWMVAAGLALAVLPDRWKAVRTRQAVLTSVESAEDVRALCIAEADDRLGGALARFLIHGALGLVFLAVAGIAWLVDKSPAPGVVAGLIVLAWSAVNLLVLFPRASRELRLLKGDDEDDDENDDEDDDGDEKRDDDVR